MVILLLAALMMGLTGYVQKRMAITTVKAQIAALGVALESYKADWGYYPPTTTARCSNTGVKESTNNCILFNALCPTNAAASGRKTYLRFQNALIRTNTTTALPNICDPWGTPLNYYCSPNTASAVLNNFPDPITGTNQGYSVGGQVNLSSYDLLSYGPDKLTYVPGSAYANGNFSGWYRSGWTGSAAAIDDISNWRP